MSRKPKNLQSNRKHANACHERWAQQLNRHGASDYRDEWWEQQCGACIYYVRLVGMFNSDYGACTNPDSEFDAKVRFEHDGCDGFTSAGGWVNTGCPPD